MQKTTLDNGLVMPTIASKQKTIVQVKEIEKIYQFDAHGQKHRIGNADSLADEINKFMTNYTAHDIVNVEIQNNYDQSKSLLIEKAFITYRTVVK